MSVLWFLKARVAGTFAMPWLALVHCTAAWTNGSVYAKADESDFQVNNIHGAEQKTLQC